MDVKIIAAARAAMAQALIGYLDAGASPCQLKFYTGVKPAGPSVAPDGGHTLLGTAVCADPVASEVDGTITFGAITQDGAADASGTMSWARLLDGDGNAAMDFDVTAAGGGGAIIANTTTIVAGGPIEVNSFVIQIGA